MGLAVTLPLENRWYNLDPGNKPATSALSSTCRVFSLPAPARGIGLAPGRRSDAPSTAFIARSPHPPNQKVLPSQRDVDRSVVPRRLHRARAGARVFAYSFNHLPRFGCAAFSSRSVPRAWARREDRQVERFHGAALRECAFVVFARQHEPAPHPKMIPRPPPDQARKR